MNNKTVKTWMPRLNYPTNVAKSVSSRVSNPFRLKNRLSFEVFFYSPQSQLRIPPSLIICLKIKPQFVKNPTCVQSTLKPRHKIASLSTCRAHLHILPKMVSCISQKAPERFRVGIPILILFCKL